MQSLRVLLTGISTVVAPGRCQPLAALFNQDDRLNLGDGGRHVTEMGNTRVYFYTFPSLFSYPVMVTS